MFIIIIVMLSSCNQFEDINNSNIDTSKNDLIGETRNNILDNIETEENTKVSDVIVNESIESVNNIVVNGVLIGQYKSNQYYNFDDIDKLELKDIEGEYTIYQKDKIYLDIPIELKLRNNLYYVDSMSISNEDFNSWDDYIALSNEESALIRNSLDNYSVTDIHENIIRLILDEHELNNTPVIIDQVIKIDIDGDSELEEIIYATNFCQYEGILNEEVYRNYSPYDLKYRAYYEDLRTLEKSGIYNIIVLIDGDQEFIIHKQFNKLLDYQLKELTNEQINEIIKENNLTALQENENLIFLYDKDGKIALFETTYLPYIDEAYTSYLDAFYTQSKVINFLDLNYNDTLEIIFYNQLNYEENPQVLIYSFENENLNIVLKQEIPR
jgi:hypothetical protein